MLGITLTAYKNREDFHANILKQAIADITTGASPEDITEWVVTETPVSAAREKTSFLRSLASWRVLEANSIDLAYRIEIQTTLSVNTVMSLLQNAVSSGAFTNRVRELALSNTAGALLDASSTSVSTVVVQKARNSPGPASTNEIIGIVVGVTAVSLILFGIITHKSCLPTF